MKYDLEKILPHNHPMILIDDIKEINIDERYLIAEVVISEDKVFFDKSINGVPYLSGIEYMAQTIGCYAFYRAQRTEPKLGFLLGTRSYKNNIEKFENGKTYSIKVSEIYGDSELVSFDCLIYNECEECARAVINAYQPENAEEYLKNGF
ncbi:3-hydroxylacyl-ACP dehydratase [bacterium]|nr:3-hydroxylacyl-ACP dehydratase [bacterium]